MSIVLAIANQKGGVGKSTTANALGAGLARRGNKVLYVDLDAQGNLSYSMDAVGKPLTSLEVLTGMATATEAITKTAQGDVIPASPALTSADLLITDTGKEYRLKEALMEVSDDYDIIVLDSPPALGVLTVNALTASQTVIIPAQADAYSLQGIGLLSQTIQAVQKYCNPNLTVGGILATRYSSRTVLAKDMSDLLSQTAKEMDTKFYKARIRECVAIREAQASQTDIFTYAPKSNAVEDYSAFIDEVLEDIKKSR